MSPTIVSGGLIRSGNGFGAIANPLPLIETWTVSNATGTLNGDHSWVDFIGAHGWDVVTNAAQLENKGGLAQGGRINAVLGTDDHQVTLTVTEFLTDTTGLLAVGPAVRMQGTTDVTFYTGVVVVSGGGPGTAFLYKFVGGVQTFLASTLVTATAPMTLTLRVVGSSLRFFKDGSPILTTTDTEIPTGQYAGLQGVASGANRVRVDNWQATAAVASARIPLEMLTLAPLTGVH